MSSFFKLAPNHALGAAIATALFAAVAAAGVIRQRPCRDGSGTGELENSRIRRMLPNTLDSWRGHEAGSNSDAELWGILRDFFNKRGYTFWLASLNCHMALPWESDVVSSGFGHAPFAQGMGENTPFEKLFRYLYLNPSTIAAQTTDGRSVVIRILAIGEAGREHINILKEVSRGYLSLASYNHAIPLWELLDFEDITFGVFPKIGANVRHAYDYAPQNSVGDILDMFIQCLEALGFLHSYYIAHRDAFKDNFLVQWHPETMLVNMLPVSRPRVYLIDFETAVRFPHDTAVEDCVCTGLPVGPSFPNPERYARRTPPELLTGEPYSPFKLDVWQLSTSFDDFKSEIPEVDDIMERLRHPDPAQRPSAYEAMVSLAAIIQATPPQELFYLPTLLRPFADTAFATAPYTEPPTPYVPADAPPSDITGTHVDDQPVPTLGDRDVLPGTSD